MELESKTSQMQEELNNAPVRKATSSVDWIPRPPERQTLTGHRNPITRVAFHPVYQILATASEDTTIKIWDYETGEFERTLKGHTKAVQDLAFDAKGNILGKLMSGSFFAPNRSKSLIRTISICICSFLFG
jgi:platelet-activating factor acetylhydrolase IB subunit alpha